MESIIRYNSESDFRKKSGYEGELPLFLGDSFRNYITVNNGGNKTFVLLASTCHIMPICIHKYYIFKWVNFLFSPIKYSSGPETMKSFLDLVCDYLKKQGVQWSINTSPYILFDEYPTHAKTIRFANTAIDLERSEDEVFSSLSYPFRKAVRRAVKWDVNCVVGSKELINDFAKIEAETWSRSGVGINHTTDTYYDDMFNCMGEHVVVSMAYKDNNPQAGLVCYYDKNTCYAMLGAHTAEMEGGANNLLYWQTIQWCIERGIRKFFIVGYRLKVDEGTKVQKIQRFKDTFDGVHEEGFMFKMVFSKIHYGLYNLILKLINKKPQPDLIDQEIHKWPEYNK